MTTLEPELRLTLIEHVAHIVARDYAKIPADLVKLGFVPQGQVRVRVRVRAKVNMQAPSPPNP